MRRLFPERYRTFDSSSKRIVKYVKVGLFRTALLRGKHAKRVLQSNPLNSFINQFFKRKPLTRVCVPTDGEGWSFLEKGG